MLPINPSLYTNLHLTSNQTDILDVKSSREKNCLSIFELKINKSFQNLIILMDEEAVPEERLFNFLIGKSSLEECWGGKTWMTELLVRTYGELENRGSESHFLSESLATTLSTILGDNSAKNLLSALKRDSNSENLDLAGANLSGVSLYKANLCGADLSGADLSGANLDRANLRAANLSGSKLDGANLHAANLSGANLIETSLTGADLSGADLYKANLSSAGLSGAELTKAEFVEANLSGADLSGGNLYKADFFRANLTRTNLSGTDLRSMKVKKDQLLSARLVGAKSDKEDISTIIEKQEREEASKKYELLSQIAQKFPYGNSPFPKELAASIPEAKCVEIFRKYQLLSQITTELSFGRTNLPKDIINTIAHNIVPIRQKEIEAPLKKYQLLCQIALKVDAGHYYYDGLPSNLIHKIAMNLTEL